MADTPGRGVRSSDEASGVGDTHGGPGATGEVKWGQAVGMVPNLH